jgi:hypothetical protein
LILVALYYIINYEVKTIMPMTKRTISPLGLSIVNDVTNFIHTNAESMSKDINLTSKDGAEALANAICYAISKALAAPSIEAAFNAGMTLPVPTLPVGTLMVPQPIGNMMYSVIKPSVIEL